MLNSQWDRGNFVCVGLDSAYEKIPGCVKDHSDPESAVYDFNRGIIDLTKDSVCAYKPNIAFYSHKNSNMRDALAETCKYIRSVAPKVPIILDAKRADIGNTNNGYVTEAFDEFDTNAVTVNPYLGEEALQPFLDQGDTGVIVLCRTSNAGAAEFQNRCMVFRSVGELSDSLGVEGDDSLLLFEWTANEHGLLLVPMYQFVALRVARHWNKNGNCALVVGATAPSELEKVRRIAGPIPILVPGIGAQCVDLESVLKAGLTSRGDGLIINLSRSVIFASNGPDFAVAAAVEVAKQNAIIREFLKQRQQ
jgi:orotidine-5'-phosphate decarboxylase